MKHLLGTVEKEVEEGEDRPQATLTHQPMAVATMMAMEMNQMVAVGGLPKAHNLLLAFEAFCRLR